MTDFGFTGQQLDRSTGGLMYYGARYYLPELRRFISADTIVPGATNPQAFNRYAYVLNNPVRYVDPTGHGAEICGTNVDCWVHAAMKALKKGGGGGGNSSSPEQDVHEELEAGATAPGGGRGTNEESIPGETQEQIGFSQAAVIQSQQIKAIDAMSQTNGWRGSESVVVGAMAVGGYGNDDGTRADPEPEGPTGRLVHADPEPEGSTHILVFLDALLDSAPGVEIDWGPLFDPEPDIDFGLDIIDNEPEGVGLDGPYLSKWKGIGPNDKQPRPEGKDWIWKGSGDPGTPEGNYVNKKTGEKLRIDETGKHGKHWDYTAPDGTQWRLYPDGRVQWKKRGPKPIWTDPT